MGQMEKCPSKPNAVHELQGQRQNLTEMLVRQRIGFCFMLVANK